MQKVYVVCKVNCFRGVHIDMECAFLDKEEAENDLEKSILADDDPYNLYYLEEVYLEN